MKNDLIPVISYACRTFALALPVVECASVHGNHQSPVERRAAHIQQIGKALACLALVDQLSGVVDLLPGEARLATKFHTATLRRFHSGAGSL